MKEGYGVSLLGQLNSTLTPCQYTSNIKEGYSISRLGLLTLPITTCLLIVQKPSDVKFLSAGNLTSVMLHNDCNVNFIFNAFNFSVNLGMLIIFLSLGMVQRATLCNLVP